MWWTGERLDIPLGVLKRVTCSVDLLRPSDDRHKMN
jgi:hypothetical protein